MGMGFQSVNKTPVGSVDTLGSTQIDQPNNTDYLMGYDLPIGGRIAQLSISPQFGNGHVSLLINGTKITGIDTQPIAAPVRSRFLAQANNVFNPGDDVFLRIEDGAGSLLTVRASVITTNQAVFGLLPPPPSGIVEVQLSMTGTFANNDHITYVPPARLHKNPVLKDATMIKNAEIEDDVYVVSAYPMFPNDFTQGWTYVLSDLSVPGQILNFSYRT